MSRSVALATLLLAFSWLSACSSSPKATGCTKSTDCPSNAICVQNICQIQGGSGGAQSLVSGAGRVSGGTVTMDAVVGAPTTPNAAGGTVTVRPAEVTR